MNKGGIEDLTAEDYAKMYNHSPISTPTKIPTLLILGQKDKRVPPEAGKIYQALAKLKGINIKTYMYG